MDTLYFTTKCDANGNKYWLIVNPEAKTFKSDYNIPNWSIRYDKTPITLASKKQLKTLASEYEKIGYTEIW